MSKYELDKKDADLNGLATKALSNEELFQELMQGILSKDNTTRQNSFEILKIISKENPEFLYPKWDYFTKMLKSRNNYHKYIAAHMIADLTAVDNENKFEKIFNDYYGLLGGEKTMISSHIAINSSKIILNKPELQDKIIDLLLNIDNIHKGKQKELIKAYVIETLRKVYPEINDKEKVMEFIKLQMKSSSPKTRDLAACFIEKCY